MTQRVAVLAPFPKDEPGAPRYSVTIKESRWALAVGRGSLLAKVFNCRERFPRLRLILSRYSLGEGALYRAANTKPNWKAVIR